MRTGSGVCFDLQPHLNGKLIELRPLEWDDWHDLFAVASDPLIWEQHPASDRYEEPVFRAFFTEAMESGGAFVVIEKSSGQVIGSTRFHGYDPERSEIEIGWTFLARRCWGGRHNADMKQLMLGHAFRFVDSVVFLVGESNIRSQKAVERIGAVQCGVVEKADPNAGVSRNFRYVIKQPPWSGGIPGPGGPGGPAL